MKDSIKEILKFDPNHERSFGYWICNTCHAKFYEGGESLHGPDCENGKEGYNSCVYNFGPKELEFVKKNGYSNYGSNLLTLENITQFFPNLL